MGKNLQYENEVCNIEKLGMQYGSEVYVIGMRLSNRNEVCSMETRFAVWE